MNKTASESKTWQGNSDLSYLDTLQYPSAPTEASIPPYSPPDYQTSTAASAQPGENSQTNYHQYSSLHTANQYPPKSTGYPISSAGTLTPGAYPSAPWPNTSSQNVIILQQPPTITQPYASPIKDYMCYSVFVCLCCFWPVGLAAIIYSSLCMSAKSVGNMADARAKSRTSFILANISLVVGILGYIVIAVMIGLSLTKWKNNSGSSSTCSYYYSYGRIIYRCY